MYLKCFISFFVGTDVTNINCSCTIASSKMKVPEMVCIFLKMYHFVCVKKQVKSTTKYRLVELVIDMHRLFSCIFFF